jgi:hypothetical protein
MMFSGLLFYHDLSHILINIIGLEFNMDTVYIIYLFHVILFLMFHILDTVLPRQDFLFFSSLQFFQFPLEAATVVVCQCYRMIMHNAPKIISRKKE